MWIAAEWLLLLVLGLAGLLLFAVRGTEGSERSWAGGLCWVMVLGMTTGAAWLGGAQGPRQDFAGAGVAALLWLAVRLGAMFESVRRK